MPIKYRQVWSQCLLQLSICHEGINRDLLHIDSNMSVLQEAVAIQLEEERLVKIRDVLKELPAPHYRYSPLLPLLLIPCSFPN